MKVRAWGAALAVGAVLATGLGGPSEAATPTCPAGPHPEIAVTVTMEQFYAAIKADDRKAFHALLAPDFYAFDGGKRFTGDELLALVEAARAAGKTYDWAVTEPEPHMIGCDHAWLTHVTKGSVTDATGTTPLTWLESAVMRYEGGRWRIEFFHSTRVPPPK